MTGAERAAFATVARVLRDEATAARAEHPGSALASELQTGAGRVENWARLIVDRRIAKATRRS